MQRKCAPYVSRCISFPFPTLQIQQNLALVCRAARHAKYILFWEECYISFWIVSVSLLLGAAFLFVPWYFILQWTARVLSWTLLGPWMKLVDVYYVGRSKSLSTLKPLWLQTHGESRRSEAVTKARIDQETEVKLRAMKEHLFGRFVTRVPVLKEDRYMDIPLPESSAVPYQPDPLPLSEVAMNEAGYRRKRLLGQHIYGDMIPNVSLADIHRCLVHLLNASDLASLCSVARVSRLYRCAGRTCHR
jgi:hypothetical protein